MWLYGFDMCNINRIFSYFECYGWGLKAKKKNACESGGSSSTCQMGICKKMISGNSHGVSCLHGASLMSHFTHPSRCSCFFIFHLHQFEFLPWQRCIFFSLVCHFHQEVLANCLWVAFTISHPAFWEQIYRWQWQCSEFYNNPAAWKIFFEKSLSVMILYSCPWQKLQSVAQPIRHVNTYKTVQTRWGVNSY